MESFFFDINKIKIVNFGAKPFAGEALLPFAYDEIQTRRTGDGDDPVLHIWRHQRAFILGLRDWKLPYAERAVQWLESLGYKAAVRHSGGAAVPLDAGVLNISLIVPKMTKRINFHEEFEAFYLWMDDVFQSLGIQITKGEIAGSYCPGDYDLSIDGIKFCGIAQRRQTKASVIQAFLNVEGSGWDRASLVKQFYEIAVSDSLGSNAPTDSQQITSCPNIIESSICSLHEAAAIPSVSQVEEALVESVQKGIASVSFEQADYENDEVTEMADKLFKRYRSR